MVPPDTTAPPGGAAPPFRVLSHTADTGIEVHAATREQLIANAATGMFALMFGAGPAAPPGERVMFTVGAGTEEDLLVDTLAELLYVGEAEDLALSGFVVERAGDCAVQVTASGRSLDAARLVGPPIKAVTYHGLRVEHDTDGAGSRWRARIIFDV